MFGAPWPLSFAKLLRAKIGDARLHRQIALEGHRFTPQEAVKAGLVDQLAPSGTESVLARATELALKVAPLAKTGAWGLIKVSTISIPIFIVRNPHLFPSSCRRTCIAMLCMPPLKILVQ
jgi:enoyl-CoA hydratase/carnithine racemase